VSKSEVRILKQSSEKHS